MSHPSAERKHDGHACRALAFAAIEEDELGRSLVARFADQVAVHRDCLAVRDPELSLTYGELDRWANALAVDILERGGGGAPVAILLPQGARSVAAILGALKAGSPYVSLDPADPRSGELAHRVRAAVALAGGPKALRAPTVVVDEPASADAPRVEPDPDDVAYVFFTSGSTGRPKGVLDSHRNVLHNVLRYTNTLRIAPSDRCSLIQSPAFSGTVSTLFSALLNGASLRPFPLDRLGVAGLGRWLADERVTIYHSVPAIFRSLAHVGLGPWEEVRLVRLEGDRATAFDAGIHRRWFPASTLVNGLGLTETGLVRQLFVDPRAPLEEGVLPVGYPVPGVEVVIVDGDDRDLPTGTIGEIAVQSDHLALGYWNDPALTDAAFRQVGGRRTYLTGDLGRLRADGCLEVLGRKDGQLKILGVRVEPAEVEAELVRLPGVRDAAVATAPGRRGQGRLNAYVVREPDATLDARGIRELLRERLPTVLIPTGITFVDRLPATPSGKVDRQSLPDVPAASASRLEAASDLERGIARLFEEVLETAPVGLDDDFFTLGGDSLAAAEIVARLEAEIGTTLPISAIAAAPTVRSLAVEVGHASGHAGSSLVRLRREGVGPPLVLVHGNVGHALHYAELARVIAPGRPVWALEHPGRTAASIGEMAARHRATLLEAQPVGPYLLAGFCYGAVVAHELACRLVADGHEVGLVALLGITPSEFPHTVSPTALAAWRSTGEPSSFAARVRHHVVHARGLPARERAPYLLGRLPGLVGHLTGRYRAPARTARAFQRALDGHQPSTFPGRVLVVLHEADAAVYTPDPRREWAALACEVEVVLHPGRHHAMLEQPGVRRLGDLLTAVVDTQAPF